MERTGRSVAGYSRRPCRPRWLPDSSSESSETEGSEPARAAYGTVPRLVVTFDDDEPPPLPPPPGLIPVFTFTCEDDEPSEPSPSASPSPPPAPPSLPPAMRPLDLFALRRRTHVPDCASACDCCRTPLPDPLPIPFIDAPDEEPLIFEDSPTPLSTGEVMTPKTRRILPSLSLDRGDETARPSTQDAGCQTPATPPPSIPIPAPRLPPLSLNLVLDTKEEAARIETVHCRLRQTLDDMTKSFSLDSEDAAFESSPYATESDERTGSSKPTSDPCVPLDSAVPAPAPVLDPVDKKSWKSPDEYRPAFGKVRALTKHFDGINLRYCARTYKRNCRSSPNLSAPEERAAEPIRPLGASASLANVALATLTPEESRDRLSSDEVKSILIQLEDWSRYGSRGSEDTLAHGNEFELPNLPVEETSASLVFPEIVVKPRAVTLDTILLPSGVTEHRPPPTPRRPSLDEPSCLRKTISVSTSHIHNFVFF